MLSADFHIHTEYSSDSNLKLELLVQRVQKVGINCLAVTDHNEIEGALQLQKHAPFLVIVGEEIKTAVGEVIGLFLEEKIPPGLPVINTIERIKEQNGLVVVPHPFDRYRKSALNTRELMENIDRIDIVETFNARNIHHRDNLEAKRVAEDYKIAQIAGSDAHFIREIGNVKLALPDFKSPTELLSVLQQSELSCCRKSGLMVHGLTKMRKLRR